MVANYATIMDSYFAENPLSENTRVLYGRILGLFNEFIIEPAGCTSGDVIRFLDDQRGWGESMRYVAVCAIRSYIRWKYGSEHPALRARVRKARSRPGRVLSEKQVKDLLASFDTSRRKGRRDLAIACLALDTGMRVNELAMLAAADVDLSACKLVVRIKGGRWEEAVYSEYTAAMIGAWMLYRVRDDGRLFQITRNGLRVTVRRWGEGLGFCLSPHDFRRTFCVLSLRAGAPSRLVQVAGRWSSLAMVEHYSATIVPEDFKAYFPIARLMVAELARDNN